MLRTPTTLLLAVTLVLGFGCSGKDSIRTLRAKADQGDVTAQYELGVRYATGHEAPKDLTTAVSWYRRASESGYAEAQVALGRALSKGEGMPKDPAGGLKWYLKAAERGNRSAQIAAGLAYLRGEGTPVDLVQGYAWLAVADAKIHELEGRNLAAIEAQLSPSQKAEAATLIQELSKQFRRR
jgi:TPR repeat protein